MNELEQEIYKSDEANGINEELAGFFNRIERLEEEKADILNSIKEVFAEAKERGFDAKAMKEVLKLRKLDPSEREEREFLISEYAKQIGL